MEKRGKKEERKEKRAFIESFRGEDWKPHGDMRRDA